MDAGYRLVRSFRGIIQYKLKTAASVEAAVFSYIICYISRIILRQGAFFSRDEQV